MTVVKMFVFIGLWSLCQSRNRFMPNLPVGEYRVVFERSYPCEPTKNHSIQLNIFYSRKTLNVTELKGNITALIPFDDSLILEINLATWGLTGGWIPNSYIHTTKKACNELKTVAGSAFTLFANGFNIPTDSCPLPAGTYITTGIDLRKFEDNNYPKVYFYGKYKLLFKIKNVENKFIGCAVVEFNLIRPWETPIS